MRAAILLLTLSLAACEEPPHAAPPGTVGHPANLGPEYKVVPVQMDPMRPHPPPPGGVELQHRPRGAAPAHD